MKRKKMYMQVIVLLVIALVACNQQSAATEAATEATVTETATEGAIEAATETAGQTAFEQANADLETALAPMPEKGTGVKVGAIESTLANPFWITMQEGYEATAEEWGVTVDVMATDSETDMEGQLNIMNDMLAKDYKAIALSPLTEQNMIPGIVEANQAGVAVVAVGNGVDKQALEAAGGSIAAFITSDFKAQGELGAQFIVDNAAGKGKVLIIEGIPGATQSDARRDGAKEVFEAVGMEVLPIQTANFDRQAAYDVMSATIDANPDLIGVACGNDIMALGAVEALKDKGVKDKVLVVGVDFIEEAKVPIENGELDGTVAMSPYLFGKAGLLSALKAIQGHEFKEEVVWTPLSLVTSENVAAMEGWK